MARARDHSRSGDVIEPVIKPQWYVNCQQIGREAMQVRQIAASTAPPALSCLQSPRPDRFPVTSDQAVQSGELRLIPSDPFDKVWSHWLETPQDWCISRQLWWGHRIPVYFVNIEGDKNDVRPPAAASRRPVHTSLSLTHKDLCVPPYHIAQRQHTLGVGAHRGGGARACARQVPRRQAGLDHPHPRFAGVRAPTRPRAILPLSQHDPHRCGHADEDVLDTWFSSALFPFSIMGWPDKVRCGGRARGRALGRAAGGGGFGAGFRDDHRRSLYPAPSLLPFRPRLLPFRPRLSAPLPGLTPTPSFSGIRLIPSSDLFRPPPCPDRRRTSRTFTRTRSWRRATTFCSSGSRAWS